VDAFSIHWSNFNFFAFPPFSLIPKCTKDYKGNITDPCVANTDLVSTCPPTTVQPTLDFQAITKPATSCSLQGATSTTQSPASDGLSFIRNTFAQQDLSLDITDILMASWRTGTKKIEILSHDQGGMPRPLLVISSFACKQLLLSYFLTHPHALNNELRLCCAISCDLLPPWSCDRISIKLQLTGKSRLTFQFSITDP